MGFRRSRRLWVAGEVEGSWVEDRWVEGSGSGSKALGSWRDLGSGFTGEVEDWFVGSWREISGSPAKSKVRGLPAMGSLFFLSLSLSLFARGRDLTLTLSLSLCFPENDI